MEVGGEGVVRFADFISKLFHFHRIFENLNIKKILRLHAHVLFI